MIKKQERKLEKSGSPAGPGGKGKLKRPSNFELAFQIRRKEIDPRKASSAARQLADEMTEDQLKQYIKPQKNTVYDPMREDNSQVPQKGFLKPAHKFRAFK